MSDDLQAKLRQAAEAYRYSIKIEQVARMEFARACAALALWDAASPEGLKSFKELTERHECKTPVDYFAAFVWYLRARAEELRRGS